MEKYNLEPNAAFNGLLNKWKGKAYCVLCNETLFYINNLENPIEPEDVYDILQYFDSRLGHVVFSHIHKKCMRERLD